VVHEIYLLIKQKYLKLNFQPRGSLKQSDSFSWPCSADFIDI